MTDSPGPLSSPVDQSLPYALSLCGAGFDVCPVRIEIPELLAHRRGRARPRTLHVLLVRD